MKVIFISDFGIHQNSGGAQVSNDIIIKQGESRGHSIKLHNYDSSPIDFLESYDVLISSNLEQIYKISPEKLKFILDHKKHFRLEHDSCFYFGNDDRQKVFGSTVINFFLSEFHVNYFRESYGDIFHNVSIIHDPIDTDLFYSDDSPKQYDIVYCGYLHQLKGLENLVKFSIQNRDRQIDVFGWGDFDCESFFKNYSNINFHHRLAHKEVANVFRSAKSIFHSPIVNEPFCRMVGEALLCGVEEVLGNPEKIGSFLEYKRLGADTFKSECSKASITFWDKIESSL